MFLKRVKLTEKRRRAKPVRLGKYAFCVQTSRNGFLTCRYFLSATHQLLAFLGKKETLLNFLFFSFFPNSLIFLKMVETRCQQWNMSRNNLYHQMNCSANASAVYVFMPIDSTVKSIICSILASIGIMGFLGNSLIFYFLWKKPIKRRSLIQKSPFVRNFNLYVRSLSLSDILASAISIPLVCIQILFDVFQNGWACKIVRYLNFIFPSITINNLIVISLEKYLSTRSIPRTFTTKAVRRMIIWAWVFGMVFMLLAATPYGGIRLDLNQTHYTTICFYKYQFYPFRMPLVVVVVQYILPGSFITFVNFCLLKTIWIRGNRAMIKGLNNAFKAKLIATRMKGMTLLILITFAFIVCYFFFLANLLYNHIAKPYRDFQTDFISRYGFGGIVFLNGVMNVVIYFVQMSDFREFLWRSFCKKNRTANSDKVQTVAMSDPTEGQRDKNSHLKELKVTSQPATIATSQNKNNEDNNNDL